VLQLGYTAKAVIRVAVTVNLIPIVGFDRGISCTIVRLAAFGPFSPAICVVKLTYID